MRVLLAVSVLAALAAAADERSLKRLLVESNDQFSAKVFSEVVQEKPFQSVVLSAFSVLPPLAQLALASVGQSRRQLLQATGLRDDDTVKEVIPVLNNRLRSIEGITLNLANRVYIPDNVALNPEFAKLARDVFQSEVKNVDFNKKFETAREINSWVEQRTNHRVQNLVSPLSLGGDTRALLVNALYFKGNWSQPFSPLLTSERDFHVSKETTVKVPTMYQTGYFKYGESQELNAQLLELPYAGGEASLLVVLPGERAGLPALLARLRDPAALPRAAAAMQFAKVDVYLPKFKTETTTDLKDVLQKIGITKLFTSGEARLERLLRGPDELYVSAALQKAFIEVGELGAEAAAANEFNIQVPMVPPPTPVFQADRPFYYEIRTNLDVGNKPQNTNTISLFTGVLKNP